MRKEDLREATKRAAERDGHKLKTRLSQGEKRKRKATVAAVYSIERQVRTPIHQGRGKSEGGSILKCEPAANLVGRASKR